MHLRTGSLGAVTCAMSLLFAASPGHAQSTTGTTGNVLSFSSAQTNAAIGSSCYCPGSQTVPCVSNLGGSGVSGGGGAGGSGGAGGGGGCTNCGVRASGTSSLGLPPNYQAVSTQPDFPQRVGSSEGMSSGSLITNATMEFFHWAWDVPRTGIDDVGLVRLHRPIDMSLGGSFGPGVFCNYDQTLTCTLDSNGQVVEAELFDPQTTIRKFYDRHSNYATYTNMGYTGTIPSYEILVPRTGGNNQLPSARERLKRIQLLDSSLTPTNSSHPTAAYVSLQAYDGSEVLFKLFDIGVTGSRTGKLAKTTSSTGATTTVAFKTWSSADLAASPTRAFQIDTVTDRFGKQLTFSYSSTQVSGGWVVSSIATPFGGSVTYTYQNGKLYQAGLLSGATATFTPGTDSTSMTSTVAIDDPTADPGHQHKTVYLSAQGSTNGYGYYVTIPLNGIRMMTNDDGEVAYLSVRNTASDQLHYEGGGRAKWLGSSTLNLNTSYMQPGWSFGGGGTGYGGSTSFNGTLDPMQYQHSDASSGASATNTEVYDEAGHVTTYVSDDKSRTIFVKHSDGTFEAYCYDDFSNVTRYRNRLGQVTLSTYDSLGRKIEEEVGLVDNSATNSSGYNDLTNYNRCATDDVQTADYAVRSWEYVASGNPGAGMLAAEIDWLGNRRDYYYDTSGRLSEIKEPPMVANGARASTLYSYSSTTGALATVTDPDGQVTSFTYDSAGRLTTTTYADTSTEVTVYGTSGTAIDRVVKTVDRGGVVTTYAYDDTGRLVEKVTAAAVRSGGTETATPDIASTETYEYVAGSDLLWKKRQDGALTEYLYDHRGRLIQTTTHPRSGKSLATSSTYQDGLLFSTTDSAGRKTYYAYDATDGRLIRTVKAAVPSWAPTTLTNAGILALTRDLNPNAQYVIHDLVYDAQGQIVDAYDGREVQTRNEYDSRGRLTNKYSAYGTSVVTRIGTIYDDASNVIEIRSPRYFDSSDSNGYLKAHDSWTYNGRNLRATHTEAVGATEEATESFTYDLKGRPVTRTDFRGKVWTTVYDSCCDHAVASQDPLGHGSIRNANSRGFVVHTATVSDVADHVADMASPVNAKTLGEVTTRYDGRGRPVASTTWLVALGAVDRENPPIAGLDGVSAGDGLTTQYLYDDDLTDGAGLDSTAGVTYTKMATSGTFSVSLAGALAQLAAAQANGGAGIAFGTDAPGRASVVINGQDEVSFTLQDATGRTVMSGKLDNYTGTANALLTWSTQLHDTVATVTGYGDCLETANIDALGKATKSLVDGVGRAIRKIDELGNATVYTYDASGNQLSVRDANNVGRDVVYDELGRPGLTTDTASDTTSTTYDKSGNRTAAIDGKSHSTLYVYDARGRKTSETDRLSGATSFTYLSTGQLASLTDAENQTTSYTYDDAGRRLTETYPDHTGGTPGQSTYGIVSFANDAAGRVLRKQDQNGDTCTYTYDLAGRLTQRDYRTLANSPSGTISDSDTLTYNKASRMLTAVSGRYSNTVTFTYDTAGRRATESLTIASQTYTTTIGYDAKNQLTSYTYPDGAVVGRSYTDRGALYQLTHAGTTIDTRAYDNGGRLTSSTYNNGVSESRSYNADDTLASISFSGAAIGNLSYGWDDNKNKTAETISGTMSGYGFSVPTSGYDNENRLVSYSRSDGNLDQSWSLSEVGDWDSVTTEGTTQSRTHGPTHELLSAGGSSVSSDVKGNITLIPSALRPNSSSLLLSWDFDNRLRSADVGNNSSVDVTYKFDALGRRVFRDDGTTATVYVHAGDRVIADYPSGNAAGSPTYRYVYASYIDEPALRYRPSNSESLYYHRNQQYSIVALTNSSGTIVERYAYSGYGVPIITDGAGSGLSASAYNNRYTYTGREWDGVLFLYHYRARMYDANLGRFCSRDPKGYAGSPFDLYEFLESRTLSSVDPMGLACCPNGKQPFKVCIRCDTGHCWIYFSDPNTGVQHTYGRWMCGYGGVNTSGVQTDVELNAGRGFSFERCTETCNFSPRVTPGYGWYGNNCATYATSIWLDTSGEHLNAVDWYGGDHPDQVCTSISNANGGLPTNCSSGTCGPTGDGSSGSSGSSSGSSNGSSSSSLCGGGGSGSCSSIGCFGGSSGESSGSSAGSSGSSGGYW